MSTTLNHAVEREYLALVRAFPLLSIRDDAHLDEAMAIIDRLTSISRRSEAEDAYLNALTDLVEIYESAHVVIPLISPADGLRALMEENGLTAEDMMKSPDEAARIVRQWLLAHGGAIESIQHEHLAIENNALTPPSQPATWQALVRYFATALAVPPDARDAFVDVMSEGATRRASKSANGE